MEQSYQIVYVDKPEASAWGIIGRGVHDHNLKHAGDEGFQRLCFVLQAPDQAIAGGVMAEIFWGWLHIDLLWVAEALRGRGYGRRLLTRVEDEARQQGAKHAFLDTFGFQAPGFYERQGYRVFGQLEEFPPGHRRYYMTKKL